MNRLNFNQSVGFPLETNILDDMQTGYSIFNALGAIVGNFTIIMGCTTVGTTVSDGVVFINGEVLEFKGGVAQSNVIIVEEKQALEFEDGNAHNVIFIRYATFGTATTQWPWADFKRGMETKAIPAALEQKEEKATVTAMLARIVALEARPVSNIPIGLIAIWDRPADQIPSGWAEYLPLKGRMPIGLDTSDPLFDTILGYGGAKDKKLTVAELPPHTHGLKLSRVNLSFSSGSEGMFRGTTETDQTGSAGGNAAFSIMNPYRVVHFIKYVG
jgi:hypothetical protein